MERPLTSPIASSPGTVDALAIDMRGVTRHQGSFTLGPLDLRVPTGEVLGFVGPNGAGKTTTIKTLLGIVPTDSGSLRVLGGPPDRAMARTGVALDSPTLAPGWSAPQAAKALQRFYPTWNTQTFTTLLTRFEVPTHTRVKDLSRGEGLKLSLALALAHDPDLLVLDEPTSGIDPVARLDILDVLRDFMVDPTHSILFSTHITSDLERIADRLHVIARGHTVFEGTLDELGEQWAIARAPREDLDTRARSALVGARTTRSGTVEALVATTDTALLPRSAVLDEVTLDEAVAAFTRSTKEH